MRTLSPVLLVALGACSTASSWRAESAMTAGEKLGGCAVGDLDPDSPGAEIAVVSTSGKVRIAWDRHRAVGTAPRGPLGSDLPVAATPDDTPWESAVVAELPGEMIQCAIGDADPARDGLELVVVGMLTGKEDSAGTGAAHVIYKEGHEWRTEALCTDTALIHGVAIARGEVFVVGFSNVAHRVVKTAGEWTATKIADLPGPGKAALCQGDAVLVGCADGSLVRLERSADGPTWRVDTLDKREAGRSRLATDGTAVLTSDDDGSLTYVTASGSFPLHHEELKLRGAVLADLDPHSDGLEAATAGYGKRVTLLRRSETGWTPELLFTATDRLHHLAVGDVDGDGDLELVTCGFDGSLVVLRR